MMNYKIKNKEISLILCILGGWFGLHHFYNKKIGLGFLYFCTCGFFCIGWIIDMFKIISIKEEIDYTKFKICMYCGEKKQKRKQILHKMWKLTFR